MPKCNNKASEDVVGPGPVQTSPCLSRRSKGSHPGQARGSGIAFEVSLIGLNQTGENFRWCRRQVSSTVSSRSTNRSPFGVGSMPWFGEVHF
jgi:hypothetical protein